jgi:DNA-binding XRE family transcriptional regulator
VEADGVAAQPPRTSSTADAETKRMYCKMKSSRDGYPIHVMASHNAYQTHCWWACAVSESSPVPHPNFDALRISLAQHRRDRGWSYDELAARSGVGRATLVAIESGKPRRNPGKPATTGTLLTWYRIARALDVELGELLRPLYVEAEGD